MTGYFQRMAELREAEMHYKELQDAIRLYAAGDEFDPDRINYTDCPACGRARKLMVVRTDDGRPFYRCFAATCGVEGFVDGAYTPPRSGEKTAPVRRTYALEDLVFTRIAPRTYDGMCARWGWLAARAARDYAAYHWRWSETRQRVAFPHYGPNGLARAYVLRSLGQAKNKAVLLPLRAQGPLTGWMQAERLQSVRPLVVVEDPISAARLHLGGASALCLGGTTLTDDACTELVDYGGRNYTEVHVALDADATRRGLELVRRLRGLMPHTSVSLLGLTADFKDMDANTFASYVDAL